MATFQNAATPTKISDATSHTSAGLDDLTKATTETGLFNLEGLDVINLLLKSLIGTMLIGIYFLGILGAVLYGLTGTKLGNFFFDYLLE
jgi:hypothetical protein